MKKSSLFFLLCIQLLFAIAQPPAIEKVRELRQEKEHEWLAEFMQLLAIPNVASDTYNIQRNAS